MTACHKEAKIKTYTGQIFDLWNPIPEQVSIPDIAHALSNICRFGGHTRVHYSVAQHSVLVSSQLNSKDALVGLLHDAAEAYVGDMVKPLKNALPEFSEVEARIWQAICSRFGIDPVLPLSVKTADLRMLRTEQRDLFPSIAPGLFSEGEAPYPAIVSPWPRSTAETIFLENFHLWYEA